MSDPTPPALSRFEQAQDSSYPAVLRELKAGKKTSHWIWFIFPQLLGLGSSPTSQYFGLRGIEEARQYLAHPLLGARLRECSALLLEHRGRPVGDILPAPDDLKLASSMTLFSHASGPGESLFREVLKAFFQSKEDTLTRRWLETGEFHGPFRDTPSQLPPAP